MSVLYRLQLFMVVFISIALWSSCTTTPDADAGKTVILKWPEGKKAAISLTYDDGTINQFRIALPLMDSLGFPATFYIVTGDIPDSENQPKFVGRPADEILAETGTVPTNTDNLFERASLAAYIDYRGMRDYHTEAGSLYEQGKVDEACQLMDEAYSELRDGKLSKRQSASDAEGYFSNTITWEEIEKIAGNGHEFGSHTITHPRLAVLDEANLKYELEGSREDIISNLGLAHTFSAECPYGTEDERVMEYAHQVYPALRNRMPAPYLNELNRWNDADPGTFDGEYVQWQRGPHTDTPMDLMKSWIDTCLVNNNIWLVLVFHGVEGIGWEPKTKEELTTYFSYIKDHEDDLWVGTFADVTKYVRERMNTTVSAVMGEDSIEVNLESNLDPGIYNLDLTLETIIPDHWESVRVLQDGEELPYTRSWDQDGTSVIYKANPKRGSVSVVNK